MLQATFHIESKCLRDEPRDCGNSDRLVTSVLRHHVVKGTSSMSNPRCRRRERFLVLTSAHRVERLPSNWCVKTPIARMEHPKQTDWPQRAIVAERYSGGRSDMKYVERQQLTYVDYTCSRTVQYLSCCYSYYALLLGSITIA